MNETLSPSPTLPRKILAGIMVMMGILHFTHGETFASIMPDYLPWHLPLVYLSGVFEAGLGVALLFERTRVLAAWGLIALFIAVFPANVNMALHPDLEIAGLSPDLPHPPAIALWLRLPLQLALIWWAAQYRKPAAPSLAGSRS
ncbi:MAG: DoxX family protein [Myxococcales bacterium]